MKYTYQIISVIIILCSLALSGGSYWYYDQQVQKHGVSEQKLSQINAKLEVSKTRLSWLLKDKKIYDKLVADHIFGNEDRLGWIETIDNITKTEKIPYVKFTLKQQQRTELPFSQLSTTGIDIFKTLMELKFSLLDESDLFVLLNLLDRRAQGFFLIDSCELVTQIKNEAELLEPIDYKKPIDTVRKEIYQHNIDGKCYLNWYTIDQEKSLSELGESMIEGESI